MEQARFLMGFRHKVSIVAQKHSHTAMEIVYHVEGEGDTVIDGDAVEFFIRDSVVIYWPDVPHTQTVRKHGEDACVMLDVSGVSWLPAGMRHMKITLLEDAYLRQELLRLADTPAPISERQAQALSLRATALLLDLSELAAHDNAGRDKAPALRQVEQAWLYVAQNFRTLDSLQEVAGHVSLSLDYLRHRFRERHGISLKQFVMDVRVKQAELLLRHSPLPQKQIAEDCGFANTRYFNASFKRATGMTPGKFRKAHG